MDLHNPVRKKPAPFPFKKGDMLVLFGELFNRGYGNGLVEEAEKHGMTIVRATVGRRDDNNELRALTAEESEKIPKPFINVPLEAGFDLEKDSSGKTPNDYLKEVKLSEWQSAKVPDNSMNECKDSGRKSFKKRVKSFLTELDKYVQPGQHIHFAHLMAGGVPRCKIVMPLMNRAFKGTGDRYLASETLWNSGVGEFLQQNFHEVTAQTFNILIDESTELRNRVQKSGGKVSYVAYGYHGTDILIDNKYKWQSYAPYIQGWAKVDLENFSKAWFTKGVQCCVYNCPEILTNSSSIFQGVEIPLYNLVRSFEFENPNHPVTKKIIAECESSLKDAGSIKEIYTIVQNFIHSPEARKLSVFENWPQHSFKEQLALMLETSDKIISFHKDEKNLMTNALSELIFKACGYVMLHEGAHPKDPVAWIGHDVVVKCLLE